MQQTHAMRDLTRSNFSAFFRPSNTDVEIPHTSPRSPKVLNLKGGSNIPQVERTKSMFQLSYQKFGGSFPTSFPSPFVCKNNPHPAATMAAFEVNYNSIRKVLFLQVVLIKGKWRQTNEKSLPESVGKVLPFFFFLAKGKILRPSDVRCKHYYWSPQGRVSDNYRISALLWMKRRPEKCQNGDGFWVSGKQSVLNGWSGASDEEEGEVGCILMCFWQVGESLWFWYQQL